MKPRFLELCGINSFSEPATIDFTKLLEFGVFGIFGDTGSGKSTILDCIGFALYGNVARARSGSVADLINYKKDKAYVRYEFEIVFGGKRRIFRVEREIKRKNAAQSVRVFEKTEEGEITVTDGVRESNAFLERLIGLEQKDFEKCIALPQGEFAQFVKAQRADRLKLVSRLFDLEAYGVGLTKRVNRHCAEHREERRVLQARLEPYSEIDGGKNAALAEQIAQAEERGRRETAALTEALAREQTLSALFEKGEEARALETRLAELAARRGEMDALSKELSRLAYAETATAAAREAERLQNKANEAERIAAGVGEKLRAAEEKERELAAFDESACDKEIRALAEEKGKAVAAAEAQARKARIAEELGKAERALHAEAECFRGFDYEARRAALEAERDALGEGDFLSYATERGKAALFREEYAAFASELYALETKYPEIAEDARPLREKYVALSQGEKLDRAAVRAAYDAREAERKRVSDALVSLETARGKYAVHCQRLQHLSETVQRLKEEGRACAQEFPALPLAEIERRLREAESGKKRREEARKAAQAAHADALAKSAAVREAASAARAAYEAGMSRLKEALRAGMFSSAEEAGALCLKYGDAEEAKRRVRAYETELAAKTARREELKKLDFGAATREAVEAAKAERARLQAEKEAHAAQLALLRDEYGRNVRALEEKERLERLYAQNEARCALYDRLQSLIEGNRFMEFVAEEYLQTIASHASERLLTLTDGRYFLTYRGGFFAGDNFNGGAERGVYTLSGGETFLVSLSLALALGAEICRRSMRPIEFFFLDEGFGTLDERLVDVVMDSLEKLRSENFSIGIISHVEELKHRIDRKLTVKKATERHGSQIISE